MSCAFMCNGPIIFTSVGKGGGRLSYCEIGQAYFCMITMIKCCYVYPGCVALHEE